MVDSVATESHALQKLQISGQPALMVSWIFASPLILSLPLQAVDVSLVVWLIVTRIAAFVTHASSVIPPPPALAH